MRRGGGTEKRSGRVSHEGRDGNGSPDRVTVAWFGGLGSRKLLHPAMVWDPPPLSTSILSDPIPPVITLGFKPW